MWNQESKQFPIHYNKHNPWITPIRSNTTFLKYIDEVLIDIATLFTAHIHTVGSIPITPMSSEQ